MRVPVYERRAGIAPLSMPQEQPVPQLSDNGETTTKTLHGVFDRLQEFQNGMEDARTLELFNKFKMDSQEYHENPDNGIYHTRLGYKSYGTYRDADEWLRKKGEDYARELPSRRAQFNFRKMAREHIQQRGLQNSRFEAEQVKRYEQETADASIKNSLIYAEQNWNNPKAVDQARRDIQQALELKMRGSGVEAFKNAYTEIEDQIGIARIRQAFTEHPLLAVDMLNHEDIHLKPETEAKLRESLTNKTEVYRLHAIASSYAKLYLPSQAVEARKKIIERYGPDEGEKAFAALSKIWSVDTYQKNAREQHEQEAFKRNQDALLERFNDPNKSNPSLREILSARISPQAKHTFISMLEQEENKAARAFDAQHKALQDKNDLELWSFELRGNFVDNEQLEQFVRSGSITQSTADRHIRQREEYQRRQEQTQNKQLQQNKSDFVQKIMQGTLTAEEVEAASGTLLKPEDALTLRDRLRSEQERKQRTQKELEAQQARELSEAEKKQAQADWENRQEQLDTEAQRLSAMREGEGLKHILSRKDLSMRERDFLLQRFKVHRNARTLSEKENAQDLKSIAEQLHQDRLYYASTFSTLDEINQARRLYNEMFGEKTITKQQRDELLSELDKNERKLKAQQTEDERQQKEQQKAQHLADLEARANQIYNQFPSRKGEALQFINALELPYEDKTTLHSMTSRLFDDEAQAVKDNNNKLNEAHRESYLALWNETMHFETQTQIDDARKNYQEMKANGWLKDEEYSQLTAILNNKERVLAEVTRHEQTQRNFDDAKDIFSKYGLNGQHDGRKYINETYSDPAQNREIITHFNRLAQEAQSEQNSKDKALAAQQDNTYLEIIRDIRDTMRPVPEARLRELEDTQGLKREQADRIRLMNAGLTTREGVEKSLRESNFNDFNSKTFAEQEAMILQYAGTSEDKRKANFTELFQKAVNDTLTDAEIAHALAWMQITKDDAENIKNYGAKLDKQQRSRLMAAKDRMTQILRSMTNGGKDTSRILTDALVEFSIATANIEPRASNFDDVVEKTVQGILQLAIDNYSYGKKLTERKFVWDWIPWQDVPSPLGQRVNNTLQEAQNFSLPQADYSMPFMNMSGDVQAISPSGAITSYDNSAPMPQIPQRETALDVTGFWQRFSQRVDNLVRTLPEPYISDNLYAPPSLPQTSNSTPQPLQGVIDSTKSILDGISYRISSGFSKAATALRNGRSHQAIDAAVPVGTPVRVPNYGATWTVTGTGENNTAGKFVKVAATLESGDIHEYTFAHLSSVDVAKGDTVSSADVVAKSGNTGHSTGPHLHISLKVNGKTVDPRNVDVGSGGGVSQEFAPQQLVPPVLSSDEEQRARVLEILFGTGGLSGDILTDIPYGGY